MVLQSASSEPLNKLGVQLHLEVALEHLRHGASLERSVRELLELGRVDLRDFRARGELHRSDLEASADLFPRAHGVRLDAVRRRAVAFQLSAERHAEARGVSCCQESFGW